MAPTSICITCGAPITYLPYLRGKRWLANGPKKGPVCKDGWGHEPDPEKTETTE